MFAVASYLFRGHVCCPAPRWFCRQAGQDRTRGLRCQPLAAETWTAVPGRCGSAGQASASAIAPCVMPCVITPPWAWPSDAYSPISGLVIALGSSRWPAHQTRHAESLYTALHASHQRRGWALHPDRLAGVGPRIRLSRPPGACSPFAALATWLQLATPTRWPEQRTSDQRSSVLRGNLV